MLSLAKVAETYLKLHDTSTYLHLPTLRYPVEHLLAHLCRLLYVTKVVGKSFVVHATIVNSFNLRVFFPSLSFLNSLAIKFRQVFWLLVDNNFVTASSTPKKWYLISHAHIEFKKEITVK